MLTKSAFKKDIDIHLHKLKKRRYKIYMVDSEDAEVKYVKHNIDRYYDVIKELDKIVKEKKGKLRLLDIGTSPFTFIIRNKYKNIIIDSVDISDHFSKLAKAEKINFKKVDLNKKNASLGKNKYDVVLFLEVLEHLSGDHKLVISKVADSLKKGGVGIIQTPNKFAPKALLTSIVSFKVWDMFSRRPIINPEFAHFKEYSLNELVSLIKSFDNLKVNKAAHSLYFDTTASSMVYRNENVKWLKKLMQLNYRLASTFPGLRRGMQVSFTKI